MSLSHWDCIPSTSSSHMFSQASTSHPARHPLSDSTSPKFRPVSYPRKLPIIDFVGYDPLNIPIDEEEALLLDVLDRWNPKAAFTALTPHEVGQLVSLRMSMARGTARRGFRYHMHRRLQARDEELMAYRSQDHYNHIMAQENAEPLDTDMGPMLASFSQVSFRRNQPMDVDIGTIEPIDAASRTSIGTSSSKVRNRSSFENSNRVSETAAPQSSTDPTSPLSGDAMDCTGPVDLSSDLTTHQTSGQASREESQQHTSYITRSSSHPNSSQALSPRANWNAQSDTVIREETPDISIGIEFSDASSIVSTASSGKRGRDDEHADATPSKKQKNTAADEADVAM